MKALMLLLARIAYFNTYESQPKGPIYRAGPQAAEQQHPTHPQGLHVSFIPRIYSTRIPTAIHLNVGFKAQPFLQIQIQALEG
jgi:hypothetical protein